MWTTDWHLARDYTPGDREDIWFLKNEDVDICSTDEDLFLQAKGLLVGVFEKDTESILLSDNTRVAIEEVYQWKSITDIELMNYPKDGSTIAVLLKDFPCYSLGMYTCRYINPDSGERVKAVMLDPSYNFDPNHEESLVLDWNYAYKYSYAPEIKILRGIPQGDFLKKENETPNASLCTVETPIEIEEKPLTPSSGSAIIKSKKEGKSIFENRIRESGVKWKAIPPKSNPEEGRPWLTYVASGYPTIVNYQRSVNGLNRDMCSEDRKYSVYVKGVSLDRYFSTLRAAKAYAEAHPDSEFSKKEDLIKAKKEEKFSESEEKLTFDKLVYILKENGWKEEEISSKSPTKELKFTKEGRKGYFILKKAQEDWADRIEYHSLAREIWQRNDFDIFFNRCYIKHGYILKVKPGSENYTGSQLANPPYVYL